MCSNMILYAYKLYHPGFAVQQWHVFVSYLAVSWTCCLTVMFAQCALPWISRLGSFFIITGFFISIIVCAVMPSQTGAGYASHSFVWADWSNETGYSSDGFVFLAGMLNGAFAIGAIDCVTHIAEEIPQYALTLQFHFNTNYFQSSPKYSKGPGLPNRDWIRYRYLLPHLDFLRCQ